MKKDFFAGKKVLVMGLGKFGGGIDSAIFASKAGAKVIVTDQAKPEKLKDSVNQLKEFSNIEFHIGAHYENDFAQSDIIIANPAVPPDNSFLQISRKAGKLVTSQMNIFFQMCPATIIGITGANGKSTTTALTAHLLKAGIGQKDFKYRQVWLSGNIGHRPLLDILDDITENDLAVLEISSFQAEQLGEIRQAPKATILTNLTPNHLDRHGTFENYCAAKENLFKYQKLDKKAPSLSVFNAEDKIAVSWYEKYSKEKGRICVKFCPDNVPEETRRNFGLVGRANLENLAAAMAVAKHFGVKLENIDKNLSQFKSLPHRLELVAEIKGVRWYNDSIATTPPSVIVALEAFNQPKIIIAGGYDKKIPFDELGVKIANLAKAVVVIGQTAKQIAESVKTSPENKCQIEFADSLENAVKLAQELSCPGDVVLLSPACASYDMFDNFQQRGNMFADFVRKLI